MKFRVVTTIRASISTCGVAVSSSAISPLAFSSQIGRSLMMIVFVRASTLICPRAERAFDCFSTADSASAFA